MGSRMYVEEVTSGTPVLLGELVDDVTAIGRDVEHGIILDSAAVSSEHGIFLPFNNFWLFRDKGSTNGSWINTRKLKAEETTIIYPGDTIQLADRLLRIVSDDPAAEPSYQSLIVFSRGDILDEFVVPAVGRALAIGGTKADLRFDVDIHELPALVLEARGESIVAFAVSREVQTLLNDRPLDRLTVVKDRDELQVEHYKVIVVDPRARRTPDPAKKHFIAGDWNENVLEPNRKTKVNLAFGKRDTENSEAEDENFEEPDFSASTPAGADIHPSMRGALTPTELPKLDALEDRIVVIVGVVLLISLVILIVAWFVLRG